MKVKTLIEELSKFNPEAEIQIGIDEDEYTPNATVGVLMVRILSNGDVTIDTEFEHIT